MKEEDIRKKKLFDEFLEILENEAVEMSNGHLININCPACDAINVEDIFVKWGFHHKKCDECKTVFVSPRPSVKSLTEFYKTSDAAEFFVEKFFMPVAEIRQEKIFKPRAEYIAANLAELSDGAIVGDIGAGFGFFLTELRKLWNKAYFVAVEPSPKMANICRNKGLDVIEKMFEDVEETNYFSLVTAFELFEHLGEVQTFVKKIHKVLKSRGYVFLTTLNGLGFDMQVLWDKSKSFSPPQHLNFFNPQSISNILQKNGFLVIDVCTPGKIDWDIVENAYKKDGVSVDRFWKMLADENEIVKNTLQEWIRSNKLSSHMTILARKIT